MAIIYSYPKQISLQNTDLLIGTRFSTEPGVVPRSISFSLETLGEYINANHPLTLNQVLTAGNESLLDAKVGSIYLYDSFSPAGYLSVGASKNRIYFYGKNDIQYGYITQDSLFLYDNSSSYGFNISIPSSLTGNRVATFQDATGTVAYLDDLLTLNLDQVLDNGNVSLSDAYIGDIYLFDTSNDAYGYISSNSEQISFFNSNNLLCGSFNRGSISIDDPSSPFVMNLTVIPLSNSRSVALPDKTGTVALLSDIPAVPVSNNYGLFVQTGNSTPISGTTTETTLINGGVGTLTVPANVFQIGDSFRAVFGGVINAANNQTIRIRVKAGSVVLLDSGIQSLTNSIVNDVWSLNIDFTVRQLGAPGVASIVSLGSFHYVKTSNASTQGFAFNVVNNTTFNTTISNTLDVTVQWGSTNAGNSIYSDIFVLNKTY